MTANFILRGAEAIAGWLGDSLAREYPQFLDDGYMALTPPEKRITPQAWLDLQDVKPHTRSELYKWITQPRDVYQKIELAVREELTSRVNERVSVMIYSGRTFCTMDIETTFRAVLIHTIIRDVLSKEESP